MLSVLFLAVTAIALLAGRYPSPGFMPLRALREDPLALALFLHLRLPRVVAALLLGSVLAGAGMAFQMLFGNPLVEPGFLGVSQGAAFGAALAIVLFRGGGLPVRVSAGLFALLGLGLSYLLARRIRFGGWVLRLVLSGIAISAVFTAGVGILKFFADPLHGLPEITFWLMGGLWSVGRQEVVSILPFVLPSLVVLLLMRWRINVLSLDDRIVFSLGIAPTRERLLVLVAAAVATGAVVSVSGTVAWIGLIVPHLARRICGADTRHSLPAALLIGGMFTAVCDALARTILPGEIPLGIITSLFGAVFFLVLFTIPPSAARRRAAGERR